MHTLKMTSETERRIAILRGIELQNPLSPTFWERVGDDSPLRRDQSTITTDPQETLENLLLAWLRPGTVTEQAQTMSQLYELSYRLEGHELESDVEQVLEIASEAIYDQQSQDPERDEFSEKMRQILEQGDPESKAINRLERDRQNRDENEHNR